MRAASELILCLWPGQMKCEWESALHSWWAWHPCMPLKLKILSVASVCVCAGPEIEFPSLPGLVSIKCVTCLGLAGKTCAILMMMMTMMAEARLGACGEIIEILNAF